jgi:hypothetical protein
MFIYIYIYSENQTATTAIHCRSSLDEGAVPKKILECMQAMGVQNLTREKVASHLQVIVFSFI